MKLSGKRIMVTGGAGFIGSNLVEGLVNDNEVVVVDDFFTGKPENLSHLSSSKNLTVRQGDVRDSELMLEWLKGVEILFHLAARNLRRSIRNPIEVHDVNATGTLRLCLAALEAGVKRVVHCSSSEAYGSAIRVPMDEMHPTSPTTVYGASKLAGECYAMACHRTYGLPVVVVRPFNTYGYRVHAGGESAEVIVRFVLRVLNRQPPVIFGDGAQTRDFTFVTDIVRGVMLAAECDELVGSVVNIARGEEESINTVAQCVTKTLGRDDLEPVWTDPRPGDVRRHFADISKARRMLNFEPEVSLEQGIRLFVEWFTSQPLDFLRILRDERIRNW